MGEPRVVELTSVATCLLPDCDWTVTGKPAVVDREARRHTGERGLASGPPGGHPTATETLPVTGA